MKKTMTALLLTLLLAGAAFAAPPLEGRAGLWTWMALRADFPFEALQGKLESHGLNFTALGCFDDPSGRTRPECESDQLARLLAQRVESLNEIDVLPVVYVFNRWREPWKDEIWREYSGELTDRQERWIKTVTRATRGLELVWAPALEPRPEQEEWVERVRRAIRAHDTRPIANDYRTVTTRSGYDYLEAGVPGVSKPDYHNGDHHQAWLRAGRVSTQLSLIDAIPDEMGLLMVTVMELDGKRQALPGWLGASIADWDDARIWRRMGERTGDSAPLPVPSPPGETQPDDPLTRCLKNRLGWKWDQSPVPRFLRGARRAYVNNRVNQQAERRLLPPGVCPVE